MSRGGYPSRTVASFFVKKPTKTLNNEKKTKNAYVILLSSISNLAMREDQ